MAVFRVERNENYSTMANYHFRDKTLSWKAKGLLSNMLSLPPDWDYSLAGLETLASDKGTATRSGILELIEHNYLIRRAVREKGRIIDWEYIIFESPAECERFKQQAGKPLVEKPLVENQQVENQLVENQAQLNIKQLNNKKINNEEIKKVRKTANSFDILIDKYSNGDPEIKELLQDWLKVRKAKRAAMTDSAIEKNLNKLAGFAAESNMTIATYLDEVIRRGWQAFYPIKEQQWQKQKPKTQDAMDIIKEIYDELE